MSEYKVSKKYKRNKRKQIYRIMDKFIKQNNRIRNENNNRRIQNKPLLKEIPESKIIKELKEQKLSYRRQNMLDDIRRRESFSRAKTPEARKNAKFWYDNVYEPFRKSKKLNSQQASTIWDNARNQSYEGLEQAELDNTLEIWEIYDALR